MLKNEQKKGCQGSFSIFSYSKLVILEEYKFFIMDFFSKCDQIRRKLRIGHLLKKSVMENFIFWVVSSQKWIKINF